MRTTLDIDKPVLEQLKRLQEREKRSLSQIASSLLAEALSLHESNRLREQPLILAWETADMEGLVDLSDKDRLYRVLDEP